ncbi:MAG: hypothetical protein JXR41_11040 [Bacteroidales bacterium]|nr:hypothetical protein [Bacteroidales bacterium]MBN2763617.1 hypothetical protein [Bacteroidales bacterium]
MKKGIYILSILALSFAISCRKSGETTSITSHAEEYADTASGILIAENIIQDIVIKTTNEDDDWAKECLKGMKQKKLVDVIFEMAYSGKAVTYDFDTHEKLTARQLRQIEKKEDFSREKIGKIQFVESWYLHPEKASITKKVSSIVLGYETFDSQGQFRGYLPVFRMILN